MPRTPRSSASGEHRMRTRSISRSSLRESSPRVMTVARERAAPYQSSSSSKPAAAVPSASRTGSAPKRNSSSSAITKNHSEIDAYRALHTMTVTGSEIPHPIFDMSEASFPSAITRLWTADKFLKPTAIQAQGWSIALAGRNMVGVASTGSGKTLSFVLPALVHIMSQRKLLPGDGPIALVVTPTRELAVQIKDVAERYAAACGLKVACLYGGVPKGQQVRELSRGVELVIATPGRLADLLQQKVTTLNRVSFFVLDEADRMMDKGFLPEIKKIAKQVRPDRQTLLWSATWPKEIQKVAHDLMGENYIKVTVGSTELRANPKIKQHVILCAGTEKNDKLSDTLMSLWEESGKKTDMTKFNKTIIFVETKRNVDRLSKRLIANGWPAVPIHGGKSQNERDHALNQFKNNQRPILVATDVAARGLDVKDVQVVINFDFPNNFEDYIHRIGRTARGASTKGTSYTFFTSDDQPHAKNLISLLTEAQQEVPEGLQVMSNMRPAFGGKKQQFGKGKQFNKNQPRGDRPRNFKEQAPRTFTSAKAFSGAKESKRFRPY